jgi:Undecaprenyl-phosphate galactose phosphotransferase WbaP
MQAAEQETVDVLDAVVSTSRPVTAALRSDAQKPPATVRPCSNTGRFGARRRYAGQVLLTSAPLIAADLLALAGSTLIAFAFSGLLWSSFEPDLTFMLASLSGTFCAVCAMLGLYPGTGINPIVELKRITIALTLLFTGFFASSFVYDAGPALNACLAVAYLFALFIVPILRSFARSFFSRFCWWGQPVVIFGGGTAGTANYKYLASHPRLGLQPVGIIDDVQSHRRDRMPEPFAYLGPPERAQALANQHGIFWAVVAMPERTPSEVHRFIKTHVNNFPHMLVVPEMDGLPSLGNSVYDWGGLHSIRMKINLLLPLPRLLKEIMDISIVIVGGLLSLPLIALIALLIKISSPGPVIYGQQRIGLRGRRFQAWKFRTMMIDADKVLDKYLAAYPQLREEWEKNHKLRNDPRVTKIGRWLRLTSLDELPQLWNVLLGEMSLVGPRPIVQAEIGKYGESFDLYTKVLPGITGLWQISGRNNTTYAERVRLDSYYVRNWSPWMDLYILARTFKVVLQGEGAY